MKYLQPTVIDKMNDSRLLAHYRVCRDEVRREDCDLHYYGLSSRQEYMKREYELAFVSHYVAHLRRLLTTRAHVIRKSHTKEGVADWTRKR